MSLPTIQTAAPLPLSSSLTLGKEKLEESDEDLLTVPDLEARLAEPTNVENNNKRRRGRNPVDKEYRRLKRLLRNRVSAQEARERKKVYVSDLETTAEELHLKNTQLQEKISTLLNENSMLRKILINTRAKIDDVELTSDSANN